ncbi:MAG: DoxX family membrane protein [Pseudomonadota bacterium]
MGDALVRDKGLTPQDRLDAAAVLVLRLGVGWFIFVWAVNKVLAPQQYIDLVRWIDQVDITRTEVFVVAAIQIAICLCVFVGFGRLFSYGALLVIHGFTVYRQLPRYLDPFEINERGFPVNRNMTISLAALGAMIALILLIRRDHFSLGGYIRRQVNPDAWWA